MTGSFTPSSPSYILDPLFTKHISSKHFDTKMAFFTYTQVSVVSMATISDMNNRISTRKVS